MFRGYSVAYVDKSLRAIGGIVIFGALLGLVNALTEISFPTNATKLTWLRDIIVVPRSVLILAIVMGMFLVGITRRFVGTKSASA